MQHSHYPAGDIIMLTNTPKTGKVLLGTRRILHRLESKQENQGHAEGSGESHELRPQLSAISIQLFGRVLFYVKSVSLTVEDSTLCMHPTGTESTRL